MLLIIIEEKSYFSHENSRLIIYKNNRCHFILTTVFDKVWPHESYNHISSCLRLPSLQPIFKYLRQVLIDFLSVACSASDAIALLQNSFLVFSLDTFDWTFHRTFLSTCNSISLRLRWWVFVKYPNKNANARQIWGSSCSTKLAHMNVIYTN